jgi:hypothetical protein
MDSRARVVTADGVAIESTREGALMRGLHDLFAQYVPRWLSQLYLVEGLK